MATDPGPIRAARVRDSARREWIVEPRRDGRGRIVVFRPAHGDLEPFRASADGEPSATHLPISAADWELLARLAAAGEGHGEDAPDAAAAFRLVDRLVREAQHRQLMGAADEDQE